MSKRCFIRWNRDCNDDCMAYTRDGHKSSCKLLRLVDNLELFFLERTRAVTSSVTHPPSAPPPKVI